MEELIQIKQLPIIEERLKQLSDEINKKVKEAEALVCTEETVKIIKQVRAELNKELREIEAQRKAIKNKVLEPYMKFEENYKKYVADKYRNADLILGGRIKVVEDELKRQKEQEIKEYFEELKKANNIDFIEYGQAKINVTLTASKKSLKEQVETFINKISDDLKLIDTQEHKAEILVEYKQSLNISLAITTVTNRIKAIEEEKTKQEEIVIPKEPNEKFENKEEFVIIPIKNQVTIKLNISNDELKKVIEFLDNSKIEYKMEDR